MQILIDLPEKTIAHIRSEYGHGKGFYPLNEEDKKIVNDAIYFGTPLPKGHGRLIDADEMLIWLIDKGFVAAVGNDEIERIFTQATVIEADISKDDRCHKIETETEGYQHQVSDFVEGVKENEQTE